MMSSYADSFIRYDSTPCTFSTVQLKWLYITLFYVVYARRQADPIPTVVNEKTPTDFSGFWIRPIDCKIFRTENFFELFDPLHCAVHIYGIEEIMELN